MNWFQKISQLDQAGFKPQLENIVRSVTEGDRNRQGEVLDINLAVERVQGLIQMNSPDVVCGQFIQMVTQDGEFAGYGEYPAIRKIKNDCCGGYEMPLPEQPDPMQQNPTQLQDPSMAPMPEMGAQEAPSPMPSAEFG